MTHDNFEEVERFADVLHEFVKKLREVTTSIKVTESRGFDPIGVEKAAAILNRYDFKKIEKDLLKTYDIDKGCKEQPTAWIDMDIDLSDGTIQATIHRKFEMKGFNFHFKIYWNSAEGGDETIIGRSEFDLKIQESCKTCKHWCSKISRDYTKDLVPVHAIIDWIDADFDVDKEGGWGLWTPVLDEKGNKVVREKKGLFNDKYPQYKRSDPTPEQCAERIGCPNAMKAGIPIVHKSNRMWLSNSQITRDRWLCITTGMIVENINMDHCLHYEPKDEGQADIRKLRQNITYIVDSSKSSFDKSNNRTERTTVGEHAKQELERRSK